MKMKSLRSLVLALAKAAKSVEKTSRKNAQILASQEKKNHNPQESKDQGKGKKQTVEQFLTHEIDALYDHVQALEERYAIIKTLPHEGERAARIKERIKSLKKTLASLRRKRTLLLKKEQRKKAKENTTTKQTTKKKQAKKKTTKERTRKQTKRASSSTTKRRALPKKTSQRLQKKKSTKKSTYSSSKSKTTKKRNH